MRADNVLADGKSIYFIILFGVHFCLGNCSLPLSRITFDCNHITKLVYFFPSFKTKLLLRGESSDVYEGIIFVIGMTAFAGYCAEDKTRKQCSQKHFSFRKHGVFLLATM